ncbi:MAG: glycosyltransferase family 2 protein [Spirochaetota bacterium]
MSVLPAIGLEGHIAARMPPIIDQLPPSPAGKKGWPWTEGSPQLSDTMPNGRPWPRITIVTPSYNQGRFIEETIRSVLLQGYPNLEYIIMDGGSTDNSVEIIKKYQPWLTYWISEKDRGQAHAVNKGWRRATGEILGWLNSDDFYLPGALAKVAEAKALYGARGLIYGDAQVADENSIIRNGVKRMEGYSLIRLLREFTMPQPAVFVTSGFAAKIGFLNDKHRYALDYDFFLRAWTNDATKGFIYIPRIIAVSREHGNTKSAQSLAKGEIAFILENVQVLQNWRRLHQSKLRQEGHLRDALAVALFRQSRFLSRVGATIPSIRWLFEALALSPLVCLRRIYDGVLFRCCQRRVGRRL